MISRSSRSRSSGSGTTKLPALHRLGHLGARLQHQRQDPDVLRVDGGQRLAGADGVLVRALVAADAEDGRDGQGEPGRLRLAAALDLLRHGDALLDPLQRRVVAGLEPQVQQFEPSPRISARSSCARRSREWALA